MDKISNDDATVMTLELCDRLNAIDSLNESSAALTRVARNWLGMHPLDARFALIKAKAAEVMHRFCTEEKMITEDSLSYQTMINDPTSALYKG